MGFDVIASFMTIVGLSTPILLAGMGELITEKSGVLNLGVEGMMLLGAIGGFAAAVMTGNPWIAVLAAAAAGACGRAAVRRAGADAELQPDRDRPGADDLRHRACPRCWGCPSRGASSRRSGRSFRRRWPRIRSGR